MKKLLFLTVLLLSFLQIQAQWKFNPFTGTLDYTGNLDNAYVTGGVAYFIVSGDTVASDTLNGTTALFTMFDRHTDSLKTAYDTLSAHNTRLIAHEDSITELRADIGSGSGMVWPATAGIMLYAGGSAYGTSITNNSLSWDEAYSWGDHAEVGYLMPSDTNSIDSRLVALEASGGGTMVYPSAGIAVSTGSAWTTPITFTEDGSYLTFTYSGTSYSITDDTEKVDMDTVFVALTDTLVWSFQSGFKNAWDTACFAVGNIIGSVQYEGNHSFQMTKVKAVLAGTSPDIDIQLYTDVNMDDGTPTAMLSAALTVTSTTTGDSSTSFSDAIISTGDQFWIEVTEATAKPIFCNITVYGHYIDE